MHVFDGTGSESLKKSAGNSESIASNLLNAWVNNDRLKATERYISKNCLVIKNPPFDPRDQQKLLDRLLDFFKNFLKTLCRRPPKSQSHFATCFYACES